MAQGGGVWQIREIRRTRILQRLLLLPHNVATIRSVGFFDCLLLRLSFCTSSEFLEEVNCIRNTVTHVIGLYEVFNPPHMDKGEGYWFLGDRW